MGRDRFTNPVLTGNFADPYVLKVGDTWYAYATGDLVVNLQVAQSSDLVRWQRLDAALPEVPEWSALHKGLTWAPEVARTPAGFVMYYTIRDAADPHRFVDRDGTAYLFYSANDYGSTDYAGGQAVVRDGDGDLWLAYHAWDSAAVGDQAGGQRAMWLDRLRVEGGRPQVEGPTDGPQEAP